MPDQPQRWLATLLPTVIALLALGAAYALGTDHAAGTTRPVAAATAAPDPAELGMVVSGSGSATGVPDQLRFSITVHHSAAGVAEAMNATSADTRAVLRALLGHGVAKKDIRTAGLSVQPDYRYSGGQELITGYSASERVSVKVRDLKIAGKVISAAAGAAGNAVRIGGLTMSVADPGKLQAAARSQAIADARAKAEQFAAAAGRRLGEVVVIEESEPVSAYPTVSGTLDSAGALAGVPIDPGTQTTKVSVRVRWSFA